MQDALIKFTGFLRSDLKQGDQLDVLYQANGNSRVLLNGDLVLEVAGVDFFNYMVNTWIGAAAHTRISPTNTGARSHQRTIPHRVAWPQSRPPWPLCWLAECGKSRRQTAARAADAEREQARQAKLEQQRQQELAKARSEDRQQEEEERQARLAAEKLAKERAEQQKKQQELAIKAQAESWRVKATKTPPKPWPTNNATTCKCCNGKFKDKWNPPWLTLLGPNNSTKKA